MVTHPEITHKDVCAIRTVAHYTHSVYACPVSREEG